MTSSQTPKRRIILHLGAPKTGTTSLQYYLSENREVLESAGVVYPERMIQGGQVDPLHTHLVQMRTRRNPEVAFDGARARLAALFEASGAHSLLLSNESLLGEPYHEDKPGFFPHHEKWIGELARLFDGYEVQVIYFIRNFATFLPSYYVQYVRKGGTKTLREFCDHVTEDDLSWCPLIKGLQIAFGPDNVRIFEHAALREHPAQEVRDVFGRYAPELPDFCASSYNQNPSVGNNILAVYRLLNRIFAVLVPSARKRHLRPKMRQYLFGPLALISGNRRPRLEADLASKLREIYARDRKALGLENQR
ncbi:hypothetical protein [Kordiimonas sp.]|uniref:hypothetical protein n=1 Tax=Kordiimonas sp. TaxID=1970157 RepID=UPI003A959A9D